VALPKLVATSVVRGSQQGESHGGVYLLDFERESVSRPVDWNTADIDWQGRGWDRGLRGIAIDGERVYIAASDELFVYDPAFNLLESYRNPYLKHCHEICIFQRRLYLTSTGFDSILGFDLDRRTFCWGIHLVHKQKALQGKPFDPASAPGPSASNSFHLNSVYATKKGLFISGLKTNAVLVFNGREINKWVSVPAGVHNARPHREGVVFNDTQADLVRFIGPSGSAGFAVPGYAPEQLTHVDKDDSRVARPGFARGLCTLGDSLLAAGSSPSTVALHDLDTLKTLQSVTLSYDVRNAIHGLEVWPF
jgi:hypothetical protein